jgi:hypothetical protein
MCEKPGCYIPAKPSAFHVLTVSDKTSIWYILYFSYKFGFRKVLPDIKA